VKKADRLRIVPMKPAVEPAAAAPAAAQPKAQG
jgi:hypothetical protein